jgi:hypothetical protein
MLEFLRTSGKASDRKFQLFLVACHRQFLDRTSYEEHRQAVLVGQRNADGLATQQERHRVAEAVFWLKVEAVAARDFDLAALHRDYEAVVREKVASARVHLPAAAIEGVPRSSRWDTLRQGSTPAEQADILRDLFGPFLFRPVVIDPSWCHWNDGTVMRIAQAIYEDRYRPEGTLDQGRLSVLADALLDAGCDNEEIIAHCRQQGSVHVRGCWLIDLLLNKA